MTRLHRRSRLAFAGILAAAAIGSAAPAGAAPIDCEARLERIEARFYEIADKRGYEAATKWWDVRWQKYYNRCVI